MPEGHTIHRYAREHRRLLRGKTSTVSSPQGRFAAGAARLDGQTLTAVDPYGKHLLYRWSGGDVLHVHLGLYGAFRRHPTPDGRPPPPATPGTRLELRAEDVTIRLAGPTACELLDDDGETRLRARLGPDPLRRDADPERVWATLQRRSTGIAAAVMDQAVIAGIGNVFRAESLFVCGINPHLASRDLARPRFDLLWQTVSRMLADGVRAGSIITVDPAELGTTRRRMRVEDWRYVYKRTGLHCRRCGTPILSEPLAGRVLYFCPRCQAR